jgi:hypothetical protein
MGLKQTQEEKPIVKEAQAHITLHGPNTFTAFNGFGADEDLSGSGVGK